MQAQQISIKLFAEQRDLDQDLLIPIFHRWIREKRLGDKLLIDVADYRHVPSGPGMMIVADHAHYGMDEGVGGRLGMLFSRKRDAIGPIGPRLIEALDECLTAAQALEGEPAMQGKLTFGTDRLLVRITSRLASGNGAAAWSALEAATRPVLERVWGAGHLDLSHANADPRQALTLLARAPSTPIADLRSRL